MSTVTAKRVYFTDTSSNILIPHASAGVVDKGTAGTLTSQSCTNDAYTTLKNNSQLDASTLYYTTDDTGSGVSEYRNFPLFTPMWQDHIVSDASWLRADTFSWHSGGVYPTAYNHLVSDISGKTLQTETVGGVTISFYLADDGHKICPAAQADNVLNSYLNTGISWYYLLDTTNGYFKLPRTKWGFTGLRNSVGNYVAESLPNITGKLAIFGNTGTWGLVSDNASSNFNQQGGAFQTDTAGYTQAVQTGKSENSENVKFDASYSSSVYQNGAPVQQRSTQMYLYFFVGNTITNQTTIDVGQLTTALSNKVDITNPYIIETYVNGTSWYRIYSDGWCEQGGEVAAGVITVQFLKEFANTNNYVSADMISPATSSGYTPHTIISTKATDSFCIQEGQYSLYPQPTSLPCLWEAKGYIS